MQTALWYNADDASVHVWKILAAGTKVGYVIWHTAQGLERELCGGGAETGECW